MAIKSLQKIISLEDELFAAEQAGQDKASLWLKDQSTEILRQHEREVSALEEKIDTFKKESIEKANHEATVRLQAASVRALHVEKLDDAILVPYLVKILKIISSDIT